MTLDAKTKYVASTSFGGLDANVPLKQWPEDQPVVPLDRKTLLPVAPDQAIRAVDAPGVVIAYERDGRFWVVGGIAAWSHMQNLAREVGHPRIRISTLVLARAPVEYGLDWVKRELALAGGAPSTATAVLTCLLTAKHPLVYPQKHGAIAETFGISKRTSELKRRAAVHMKPPYRSRPVRTAAAPTPDPRSAPPGPDSSAGPLSDSAIVSACDPGSAEVVAAAPSPSISPPLNTDESTCPIATPLPSQLSLL